MNIALPIPGTPAFLIACLAGYLVIVNLWTFVCFAIDRRRALAGQGRVPAATLLLLATLGGWPAAKVAQLLLPHGGRNRPFGMLLNLSVLVLPVAAAAALIHPGDAGFGPAWQAATDSMVALIAPEEKVEPALPRRFGPGS